MDDKAGCILTVLGLLGFVVLAYLIYWAIVNIVIPGGM